ncbi:MAG: LptF/LptG family permease [Verrucomicrobia bacterium]|nr:LptF/LptG family permease [Verrucomicrobiota bacterium]
MKTLHLYLTRQVLATLLMTVAVFTFVLLLGSVLKEVLPLLMKNQGNLGILAKAVLLLVPFVLMFALPMGMLTATLLVFGRFSADQELTAARASGISLLSLAAPIVLLGLLCCGVSAWMNLQLAPQSRVAFNELRARAGIRLANALLPEGQFVKDFPDAVIYVGKNDGRNLKDVMVYLLKDQTNTFMQINAPRGEFRADAVTQVIDIRLVEARSLTMADGVLHPQFFGEWTHQLDLKKALRSGRRIPISDMTFTQLRQELSDMEKRLAAPGWGKTSPAQPPRPAAELRKQRALITSPLRLNIHRQLAFSFACFGFTLVGIPLAIRVHRRETNIGFFIALGLVAVYFSFIFLGQSLEGRPELYPHLIVWVPNLIFQTVGVVLLWRANRGT